MKHLITTAVLLFSTTVFAQVGINNTSPKATLDITAKTNGTKPEGLIIPQLTGDQIRAATTATPTPVYGSNQKGLIIYATVADSAPAGATANITAPGYYYFDGSIWQKIVTGNTPNLYNADGTLTSTRTVNTAGNSLKISGGGLLVVQTADNSGKIRLTPADTSHTGYMEVIKGDNTRLGYIGWDDTNLSYVSENGASHVFSGGKVGVGLIPEATLDVVSAGTAFTKNAILSRPASGMDSSFILKTSTGNTTSNPGDITNTFGQAYGANGALSEGFEFMRGTANSDGSLAIKTAGTERLRIDSNGNVGIGTVTPNTKLDIRTNPGSSSPGNGAIAIGETTQSAGAAGPGAIRYSTNSGGLIEYSNGSSWNTLTSTVKKSLVYGYLTTGQTLNNGGGIFAATESFDQNNDFASNTFNVSRNGNYSFSLCGLTTSSLWNQGEEFSIRVAKNGIVQVVGYWAAPTSASYYGGACTSVTLSAVAGDAIKFIYYLGASSSKTIHTADFNRFSIQEL